MSKFSNDPSRLLKEYKFGCIDVSAVLSYYLQQMKVLEVENANSGPVASICLNNLTDATCIMLQMEDQPISIASMALYVLNNRSYGGMMNDAKFDMINAIIEFKGQDHLDFGIEIKPE